MEHYIKEFLERLELRGANQIAYVGANASDAALIAAAPDMHSLLKKVRGYIIRANSDANDVDEYIRNQSVINEIDLVLTKAEGK